METRHALPALERVEADFYVTQQLHPAHLAEAAAAGFRSIVNNRPDGEGGPGQPTHRELAAAAAAAGLECHHLPVAPSGHAPQDALRMHDLVNALPKPVLAFCRTGRRAQALHAFGAALRKKE